MTVKNAKEVFKECADLPVQNWGFKDVGLPPKEMKELCQMMEGGRQEHLPGGCNLQRERVPAGRAAGRRVRF